VSKFILAEEVESLDYNFMPYGGSGTIPEPSAVQIQAFRQALGALVSEQEDTAAPSGVDDPKFIEALTLYLNADTSEMDEKVLHYAADVCSNQPSFDDLSGLPYRARQAFLGWLVGVFLVPEVPTPATTP
jgi:hypothetical protein